MLPGCARRTIGLTFLSILPACSSDTNTLADLDFHRGRNALAMERPEWARFYFAADLETSPDRPESLRGLGLGWSSGAEGSASEAIRAFERYLQLRPGDRLHLVRARLRLHDLDRALADLDGLLDAADGNLLAARLYLDRQPAVAARHVARALKAAPSESAPHLLAARVHARLGDPALSAFHASRAAELDPLHADAFYLLATALRKTGEHEGAEEAFALSSLVRRLSTARSPAEALGLARSLAEAVSGRSLALRVRLSRLLLETERLGEGARAARALAADPQCKAGPLFEVAQVAHSRGRILLARELYSAVLERRPTHRGAIAQLSQLSYETNEHHRARDLVMTGLGQDPFYAPFHFIRGVLALSAHQEVEAAEALRAAVDLAPWVARYRIALAELLLTRGEWQAFDRLLEEAPSPDPAVEAYRQRLGT